MPKIKVSKIQPIFETIDASTNTIIGITNWTIDVSKIYEKIPITDYVIIPKKRGRKKKEPEIDPNKDIKCGSIIKIGYKGTIRGVDLKKSKHYETFRNSITVIMKIESKFINFKLSQNGKFQITIIYHSSGPELIVIDNSIVEKQFGKVYVKQQSF